MRLYAPIAKIDAEERMVWGYASTEAEDEQGEVVTRVALAEALAAYMKFANIREMHQMSAVGVAAEASIDDKGLYVGARIVDERAWDKVRGGVYKGFSIGGRVTARDPCDRKIITGLALTEISLVDRPANPEAVFDCWKLAGGLPSRGEEEGDRMADTTTGARAPVQIWHCGIGTHRHLAKVEAVRCLEKQGQGDGRDPGGSGDGGPYGAIDYADPGEQPDGRERYPLDSESHIRAAWAYIHSLRNAGKYKLGQLAQIKARIIAAWKREIDPEGPPAAAAADGAGAKAARAERLRKGLAEIGRLAQLIDELDWLGRRITREGDPSPDSSQIDEIVGQLRDFLDVLIAEEIANLVDGDGGDGGTEPVVEFVAAARSRHSIHAVLAKRQAAPAEALAKTLSGEIVPRLEALAKQVEEIAQTPLPPKTAARPSGAISKREDGGGGAPLSASDIIAALSSMSDEERTLTLIRAAHANPIRPVGFTSR